MNAALIRGGARNCPLCVLAGRRRHDMDDAIAMFTQIAEKGGQHCGRLRARIVQQDDTLAGDLQPADQQLELLLGRHRFPVARPQVGAEHRDAAGLQAVEKLGSGLEIREAEERRARNVGRCAMEAMQSQPAFAEWTAAGLAETIVIDKFETD